MVSCIEKKSVRMHHNAKTKNYGKNEQNGFGENKHEQARNIILLLFVLQLTTAN
jgi:hypothetical protein